MLSRPCGINLKILPFLKVRSELNFSLRARNSRQTGLSPVSSFVKIFVNKNFLRNPLLKLIDTCH